MQHSRSNLPWIFLLLFPLAHVMLVGSLLQESEKSGYWSIGATVVFFGDILLAVALICLLYIRMSWKVRVNGMIILGIIPVFFGVFAAILDDKKAGLLMNLGMNGGAALVVVLCGLWLRTQKYLRDQ